MLIVNISNFFHVDYNAATVIFPHSCSWNDADKINFVNFFLNIE